MGRIDEFSFALRTILRVYPWRRIDPVPWAPLRKPLNRCRLALVSSAGFTAPGQDLFDGAARGGDPNFRFIPRETKINPCTRGTAVTVSITTAFGRIPTSPFPWTGPGNWSPPAGLVR